MYDDEFNDEVERGNRRAEHLKWMGADQAEFQYAEV